MVSQYGVQFCVVDGGGARDVERCLDRPMRLKGQAAVQRDVEDEPEIEINRVEGSQVCESVERFLSSFFGSRDKRDDFVHELLVQNPVRLPNHERTLCGTERGLEVSSHLIVLLGVRVVGNSPFRQHGRRPTVLERRVTTCPSRGPVASRCLHRLEGWKAAPFLASRGA
jgi:hypothetical protein